VKEERGLNEFLNDMSDRIESKSADPLDMMKEFKMDIYKDEVYVFTPKGELFKMGKGATVLDFAFSIHSQLGCKCVSGKVNGKNVSIKHVLNNGDSVEIVTASTQKPKQDWLTIVTTSKARTKIRQALREESAKAVEYAKELGCANPQIVLHLDHGDTFELCKSCIDMGFSSVMIDGSHHSYEKNVELTRKVVEYAHQYDVSVEGELGVLAGVEDDVVAESHTYTKPEEVVDFVTKTGCDSLAISIGTSHGANKFKPEQCTKNEEGILVPPPLRFDVLEAIENKLPGFPIVLHGASSVPQEEIAIINKYGGSMKDAIGIPEE